jgi:hypothetical protein
VHGHGKRREHARRKLFNFYDIRCDYGDGEFPSVWPSELEQDLVRGFDFVAMQPTDGYDATLALIANFQPVITGDWGEQPQDLGDGSNSGAWDTAEDRAGDTSPDEGADPMDLLFKEQYYDASGVSLWEGFFDYAQQKYRYFHRVSKRVVDELPPP